MNISNSQIIPSTEFLCSIDDYDATAAAAASTDVMKDSLFIIAISLYTVVAFGSLSAN